MRTGLVISLSCNRLLILLRYSTEPSTEARRQASSGRLDRPLCCFSPTEHSENDAVRVEGVGVEESEGEQEGISSPENTPGRDRKPQGLGYPQKGIDSVSAGAHHQLSPSSAAL